MKYDSISLRRRHLMIAGVTGIAAPAGLFAATIPAVTAAATPQPLIVSGRVVDATGKPVAGAKIEITGIGATTDGDGRFMLKTSAGIERGCPQTLACRITHPAHRVQAGNLEFARTSVQRDHAGTWRAGVSLNFV